MSPETIPKIPERPPRRKTIELSPSPDSEVKDTKANSEPLTPMERPTVPKQRPMLKAKTTTSFESTAVPGKLPQVPLQRPIRRSTTEELNNVMDNTSKELEEIENLISKHSTHSTWKKKSVTAARNGGVATSNQKGRPSLSDKDSCTPDQFSSGTNGHEDDGDDETAVLPPSLVNSFDGKTIKASDTQECPGNEELCATPDNKVEDRSDSEDRGDSEKNVISEGSTPPTVVSEDVEEDRSNAEASAETAEPDVEDEKFTKLPESSSEELQRHQKEEEEEFFQNPIGEKSIMSLNEKVEMDHDTEKNSHPNVYSTPATDNSDTDTKIPSELKIEQGNDTPVVPLNRTKNDLEASVQEEESPKIENKPILEKHDSTEIDVEEKDKIPNVPVERPKKRAPPPVPKKPSSRIAAFQEMLQKQQQEDLHNNATSPATTSSTDITKKNTNSSATDNTTKVNFTSKLNGLFALPGMANPGQIPASLGKKLSSPGTESTGENQEQSQVKSTPLSGARRARGPRGRKLPSKVAGVEKIEEDGNANEIEIFNVWNVHSSLPKQEISERENTAPDELTAIISNEQSENALDEKAGKTLKGQPEQPSNESGLEEEKEVTASVEPMALHPLSQTSAVSDSEAVSGESPSPSEAIANRDQDDTTEIQEQQMEAEMEAEMERELSGGYEDIDSV